MGYKTKGPRVLYTKRLWTPPKSGICRIIDKRTLRTMYEEERLIENLRFRGVDIRRTVNLSKATPLQKQIADDLFREPK